MATPNQPPQLLDGLVYLSNRASANFHGALQPMGGVPHAEASQSIDFLYFDTYQGKTPPANAGVLTQLMPRRKTVPLDHKGQLAKGLIAHGLCDPMVYFDVESVPTHPDKIWYVKNPLSTAGKAIRLARTDELATVFKPGDVIQEAVTDICLVDGHKFTIRIYVLLWQNRLYLYPDGIMVVHGVDYDPSSTDYTVQVDHTGYNDPKSAVTMGPFSRYGLHVPFMLDIARTVSAYFQAFTHSLRTEAGDASYCLFGVDYLCRPNQTVTLIEINDRPNLLHTREVNQRINIPMIRDMVILMTRAEVAAAQGYMQHFMHVGGLLD